MLKDRKKLPVTVLSGFLGAGKTTVLNQLLHNKQNIKMAVIVNDMSEVNIDARLVKDQNTLSRTEERLVEMSNGCICCTLREDLMIEVEKLALENRFDYLVIESTGISEPIPIAQTFSFSDSDSSIDLSRYAQLDTMVTVIDAFNFYKDFGSAETIQSLRLNENDQDERTIVNLLTDQIEFANVIILNKADLVVEAQLAELKAIISKLNPSAQIIQSAFGQVDPLRILNTGLFDFDEASNSAGWIKELEGIHTPETEAYGISSWVFRNKRPFHPERFLSFVSNLWPTSVIRSKGLFWIASRPNHAINWSQAGGSLRAEIAGVWWDSLSYLERASHPVYMENQVAIMEKWDKKWGDRQNELVFIGQNMNEVQIRKDLESCLCSEEEFDKIQHGARYTDSWIL